MKCAICNNEIEREAIFTRFDTNRPVWCCINCTDIEQLEIQYKSETVEDTRKPTRLSELVDRPKYIVMLPVGVGRK